MCTEAPRVLAGNRRGRTARVGTEHKHGKPAPRGETKGADCVQGWASQERKAAAGNNGCLWGGDHGPAWQGSPVPTYPSVLCGVSPTLNLGGRVRRAHGARTCLLRTRRLAKGNEVARGLWAERCQGAQKAPGPKRPPWAGRRRPQPHGGMGGGGMLTLLNYQTVTAGLLWVRHPTKRCTA